MSHLIIIITRTFVLRPKMSMTNSWAHMVSQHSNKREQIGFKKTLESRETEVGITKSKGEIIPSSGTIGREAPIAECLHYSPGHKEFSMIRRSQMRT